MKQNPKILTQSLLKWYKQAGRELPWRVKGGAHFDPYLVWISEIMLQQTTVQSVIPYFQKWMSRFPTLQTLAKASLDDVLMLWQGLGYYSRAKNIHKAARYFLSLGGIPDDKALLLKAPGIGPYSCASIMAFAFNRPEVVIDGNVMRVLSRVYGIITPINRDVILPYAQKLTPLQEGADYASAIMDLGATVCKPVSPLCPQCPWQNYCLAYQKHLTETIPVLKKSVPLDKKGVVFLLYNQKGEVYIQKRSGKGLLSGLYELPWDTQGQDFLPADWQVLPGQVHHTFTHFKLTLQIKTAVLKHPPKTLPGLFVKKSDLTLYPFPTLMKKVIPFVK